VWLRRSFVEFIQRPVLILYYFLLRLLISLINICCRRLKNCSIRKTWQSGTKLLSHSFVHNTVQAREGVSGIDCNCSFKTQSQTQTLLQWRKIIFQLLKKSSFFSSCLQKSNPKYLFNRDVDNKCDLKKGIDKWDWKKIVLFKFIASLQFTLQVPTEKKAILLNWHTR